MAIMDANHKKEVSSNDMEALRRAVTYAYENTAFYHREAFAEAIRDSDAFAGLPFTTAEDLCSHPHTAFLSQPQREVRRLVTQMTSGSTLAPKRIAFSEADLETTVSFFAQGMLSVTSPGERVMICMPGRSEFGISHLLSLGLARLGAEALHFGLIDDLDAALRALQTLRPHCIVGMPHQVLVLAQHATQAGLLPTNLHSLLLSADYLPESVRRRLERLTGCTVRNHYGSTEMGYGGALECTAQDGLHLRELDFYAEIIDPITKRPLSQGEEGELVLTTLKERAMPLVRYRTGDLARLTYEPCSCGQNSPRLIAPVRLTWGRDKVGTTSWTRRQWDELLLGIDGVLEYAFEGAELILWATDPSACNGEQVEAALQKYASQQSRLSASLQPPLNWQVRPFAQRPLQPGKRCIM